MKHLKKFENWSSEKDIDKDIDVEGLEKDDFNLDDVTEFVIDDESIIESRKTNIKKEPIKKGISQSIIAKARKKAKEAIMRKKMETKVFD